MEDTNPSIVDGERLAEQHVNMGEDEDFVDEPIVSDEELAAFEKRLFAAIRDSRRLDAEIDDEYRRLAIGDYETPGPMEGPI